MQMRSHRRIARNISLLIVLIGAMSFGSARASTGGGLIADITIEGTQWARIAASTVGGTRPTCHNTNYSVHFSLDLTTPKGKAILSLAQAAQLSGKTVGIGGAGTSCLGGFQFGGIEQISTFTILTN